MTKAQVRAAAIRWLAVKNGGMPRRYRGLDSRRVHFECGCSIIRPGEKAWKNAVTFNPGYRSKVCSDHVRALGTGSEL